MRFILHLLSDFKFARKQLGGKWYYLQQIDHGGFIGMTCYWSQAPPSPDEKIIKEENYSNLNHYYMRRRWWAFTIISVIIFITVLVYVIIDLM